VRATRGLAAVGRASALLSRGGARRRTAARRREATQWRAADYAKMSAKHHTDLILCRKQPGVGVGRVCEKCEGRCVICDSFVRPDTVVKVCDDHSYGAQRDRCLVCSSAAVSDAYYCKECCQQEKDRDGCPKVINLGSSRTDRFYENKKFDKKGR
jgi:PHD finger-like domain-containing protein 5A